MRRRNVPLWIVFAVTLCLCLRGILPAQTQAMQAHSMAMALSHNMRLVSTHSAKIHTACNAAHTSSMHEHPTATATHSGPCEDHGKDHGRSSECPLCPPALACAIGYILPDLAFFGSSPRSTSARYEWRPHPVQTGLDRVPDVRPPRLFLTV